MAVLAVIPARGGSKGVPRKNLRPVAGRSLLARAVDSARRAAGVDHVVVSTEDAEIADAARACGAEVPFLRPAALATDAAPTIPVLRHAVEAYEGHAGAPVSTVVLLEPTSPFRTQAHVAAAVARFAEGDCKSVITVMPLERKPENIFVRERHLRRYIERPDARFARRQDMAHLCRLNSAVYVIGRDDLMTAETLLLPPVGWVAMDETESINIDTLLDLSFADFLARERGL